MVRSRDYRKEIIRAKFQTLLSFIRFFVKCKILNFLRLDWYQIEIFMLRVRRTSNMKIEIPSMMINSLCKLYTNSFWFKYNMIIYFKCFCRTFLSFWFGSLYVLRYFKLTMYLLWIYSEIGDEDKKSRLLISVWNMYECNCEFLGCMSFGVRHLQPKRRDVCGWYHLLSQSAGTRKHLQVNTAKATLVSLNVMNRNSK